MRAPTATFDYILIYAVRNCYASEPARIGHMCGVCVCWQPAGENETIDNGDYVTSDDYYLVTLSEPNGFDNAPVCTMCIF